MTSAARQVIHAQTSEAEWQRVVMGLLKAFGWRAYHTFDSRRSAAGFPDIIACRGGRCLAIELKSMRGKTTVTQDDWLIHLAQTGIRTYVWRPSDETEVRRVLQ